MSDLIYQFPISGIKTYLFLPPLVMFFISSVVSMGGVSGAFILIPFQMSVLGYTAPGVTSTNFIYNIVSIPSGIYKYLKNGQMSVTLLCSIMSGTLPGIIIGYYVRTRFLLDPSRFKIFVGCVLALLGTRTLQSAWNKKGHQEQKGGLISIKAERLGIFRSRIMTSRKEYEYSFLFLASVSFLVSIVGTAYGIGGGAILAPFCVSVLGLPVYLVSGAALFSTWINSIIAALVYALFSYKSTINAMPDWMLGALFGLGGMAGIYVGASVQRHVSDRLIKFILGVTLILISLKYLFQI